MTARIIACLLCVCVCVSGLARADDGYTSAAYLESWNGGTPGGLLGSALEAVMIAIMVTELHASYDHLAYCKGADCTEKRILGDLHALTEEHQVVDLYLATHGYDDHIMVEGGSIGGEDLEALKGDWHRRHRLRAVMGMNCHGATMLESWLDFGFDVGAGSKEIDVVGWIYVPLFMSFWKKRCCAGGLELLPGLGQLSCFAGTGDCSFTFEQAMALAWMPSGVLEDLIVFVAGLLGTDTGEWDSQPETAGDGSIRITTSCGIFNACNDRGDAYGFMLADNSCCLPGETCGEQHFGCQGPEESPGGVEPGTCPDPRPVPENECAGSDDCGGFLCVASAGGTRCAVPCTQDLECGQGGRCAETIDPGGISRGRFCAVEATAEQIACMCEDIQAAGCGTAEQGSGSSSGGMGEAWMEEMTRYLDQGGGQPSTPEGLVFATGETMDWYATCGCPMDPDQALESCGLVNPCAQPQTGCSTAGGPGSLAALLGLLIVSARFRRR
ncbi:MAG: hypothetical protein JXR96_30895 [Deltaproteobacteria bacterium]|nr:hypothetical protein [Deltaproteobacteria bacterium]